MLEYAPLAVHTHTHTHTGVFGVYHMWQEKTGQAASGAFVKQKRDAFSCAKQEFVKRNVMGRDAVQFGRLPTFQRHLLSSGWACLMTDEAVVSLTSRRIM